MYELHDIYPFQVERESVGFMPRFSAMSVLKIASTARKTENKTQSRNLKMTSRNHHMGITCWNMSAFTHQAQAINCGLLHREKWNDKNIWVWTSYNMLKAFAQHQQAYLKCWWIFESKKPWEINIDDWCACSFALWCVTLYILNKFVFASVTDPGWTGSPGPCFQWI